MKSPSEMAQVLVSLSYRVIDDRVESRKDEELVRVSDEDGKIIDAAAAHAHADGARGDDKKFRVIEYYIDCGTRANGWNIGSEGASRAEWERFKRESPFYKRYYPANLDKETPDISGFQLPPFSDNRELFASIASK